MPIDHFLMMVIILLCFYSNNQIQLICCLFQRNFLKYPEKKSNIMVTKSSSSAINSNIDKIIEKPIYVNPFVNWNERNILSKLMHNHKISSPSIMNNNRRRRHMMIIRNKSFISDWLLTTIAIMFIPILTILLMIPSGLKSVYYIIQIAETIGLIQPPFATVKNGNSSDLMQQQLIWKILSPMWNNITSVG
ncbi:hypothetical protein DERP_011293 [Dermatophagoides pteronyssinus]|uniref:Uncharacterized protein n=1 Tax=Dermatophagoides pteronyssinus TaxID=6956 RepID=A0ABQ8J782_DERPT|nr:hypothetical protein DERP_011293 [Dermatophagoides pteronyssinus]